MAYERYPRGTQPGDQYNRSGQDYGRDYAASGEGYSSARDYEAAGEVGRGRGGYGRDERSDYGQNYSQYRGGGDQDRGYGQDYGQYRGGGDRERGSYQSGSSNYAGSYASDGRRFENTGDRDRNQNQNRYSESGTRDYRDYGRDPYRAQDRGYPRPQNERGDDDRGFFARAGDEVRSWFGDDDAERRRRQDEQRDARHGRDFGREHDDYHDWRRTQVDALDRDYDEYRQQNRDKFHSEFGAWRTQRQGQRDQLQNVREHQDVVGSDGGHVGTVDHVRGDRILLTKNDKDAGGQHHTIPSSWIASVDDKVTLSKTADEAKKHWRDAENNQAMFGGDRSTADATTGRTNARQDGGTDLNRSFAGTY